MMLETLEPRCAPGSLLGGAELLAATSGSLAADSYQQGIDWGEPLFSLRKARSQKNARRLPGLEALGVLQRRTERLLEEIRPTLGRLGLAAWQLPRADQVVQKLAADPSLVTGLRQGKRFFLRAGWRPTSPQACYGRKMMVEKIIRR